MRMTMAPSEDDEDLAAIRDALAEWRGGDGGTPLAEAFDEVRHAWLNKSADSGA